MKQLKITIITSIIVVSAAVAHKIITVMPKTTVVMTQIGKITALWKMEIVFCPYKE